MKKTMFAALMTAASACFSLGAQAATHGTIPFGIGPNFNTQFWGVDNRSQMLSPSQQVLNCRGGGYLDSGVQSLNPIYGDFNIDVGVGVRTWGHPSVPGYEQSQLFFVGVGGNNWIGLRRIATVDRDFYDFVYVRDGQQIDDLPVESYQFGVQPSRFSLVRQGNVISAYVYTTSWQLYHQTTLPGLPYSVNVGVQCHAQGPFMDAYFNDFRLN